MSIPFWKQAPFIRLLLPLIAGIMLQWYIVFPVGFIICSLACFLPAYSLIGFVSLAVRYKIEIIRGVLLHIIIVCSAMLLTWQQDARHHEKWYGHFYNDSTILQLRIIEPLTEKPKSYKTTGIVEAAYRNNKPVYTTGKLLIYFAKGTATAGLHYGDRILIRKTLQPIKNSGNPGEFNYERYAAFQQLYHSVYLKEEDLALLKQPSENGFRKFVFSSKARIICILQRFLPADNNVLGIAEALLIGYKEDLDKDTVQAYSNTGVVHIIAISGLHLGLIYVMLVWIFNRLPLIKRLRFVKLLLILVCLWYFSILTGASASVLRSAVMLTCVLVGKNYFSSSSVYNSLAASAFILLCYDPYFLWDVGFQLSYLAVTGIVWLQKPIYTRIHIRNKLFDRIWNMLSVTLAAQLITFPLCLYYFHQFPNLFMVTNLLAVPLSTVILFAEILLLVFSWSGVLAFYIGKITALLISFMNTAIIFFDRLPYSRLDDIYASVTTTIALYIFIGCSCYWLFSKNRMMYRLACAGLLVFTVVHVSAKLRSYRQQEIIIYNVPGHTAMDLVTGNDYFFVGDSILLENGLLQNFHLKPSRIAIQAYTYKTVMPGLFRKDNFYLFGNKKILLADSTVYPVSSTGKIPVDILLVSHYPRNSILQLLNTVKPSVIIFDASNNLWKIANWKKECESLALPCFSIPDQGAFVMDVEQQSPFINL